MLKTRREIWNNSIFGSFLVWMTIAVAGLVFSINYTSNKKLAPRQYQKKYGPKSRPVHFVVQRKNEAQIIVGIPNRKIWLNKRPMNYDQDKKEYVFPEPEGQIQLVIDRQRPKGPKSITEMIPHSYRGKGPERLNHHYGDIYLPKEWGGGTIHVLDYHITTKGEVTLQYTFDPR